MISIRLSDPLGKIEKQYLDPYLKKSSPPQAQKKVPPVERKIVKVLRKKPQTIQIDDLKKFDSHGFLRSFKRQVSDQLLLCFRYSLTELNTDSTILLSGVLTKEGVLKKPNFVSSKFKDDIDPCIESEFKKMNFKALTEKFQSDFIEIQWKISL